MAALIELIQMKYGDYRKYREEEIASFAKAVGKTDAQAALGITLE